MGNKQNSHTANDVRPHYLTFLLRNGLEHDFSFWWPTDRLSHGTKIIRLRGREKAISNNTRLSGVKFSARLLLLTFHEFAFIAKLRGFPLLPRSGKTVNELETLWGEGTAERARVLETNIPSSLRCARCAGEAGALEQQSRRR